MNAKVNQSTTSESRAALPLWQKIAPEVNKIGILCWGKLGDSIVTIPICEKILACFPNASITLICSNSTQAVYQHHPHFKQFILWQNTALKRFITLKQIRNAKFDLLLDLYHGDRSKLACLFSGAKFKVGYDKPTLLNRLAYNLKTQPKPILNWYQDYKTILKALEIDTTMDKNQATFPLDSEQQKRALRQHHLTPKTYWVFNLGAALDSKQYPLDGFLSLAQYLNQSQSPVVVLANPDKPHLQTQFSKLTADLDQIIALPELDLAALAGIIAAAKGLISVDTGIMHLGAALKTPTIALFVGIEQKVFFDGLPYYPLVEKNGIIPTPLEIIECMKKITQRECATNV